MAKELKIIVKINIKAGKATPAPPIGPSLAPHGINIGDFCSKFNEATRAMGECTVPAEVRIYQDRSFEFKLKTPLTSELIKKILGIPKGSGEPNKKKVGKITQAQLREIAEKKLPDLNTKDIDRAIKIVAGTAKNMGVSVE
ncbi:MAG: 50S ribosomal protein L11 [Candidatus Gribaldobacteria bacterium]|nr:50S ribosomal protein L11 [Candidatus Gribaldobacteria bacterium]